MEHHVSRPTLEVIRAVADALEGSVGFLDEVKSRICPESDKSPKKN